MLIQKQAGGGLVFHHPQEVARVTAARKANEDLLAGRDLLGANPFLPTPGDQRKGFYLLYLGQAYSRKKGTPAWAIQQQLMLAALIHAGVYKPIKWHKLNDRFFRRKKRFVSFAHRQTEALSGATSLVAVKKDTAGEVFHCSVPWSVVKAEALNMLYNGYYDNESSEESTSAVMLAGPGDDDENGDEYNDDEGQDRDDDGPITVDEEGNIVEEEKSDEPRLSDSKELGAPGNAPPPNVRSVSVSPKDLKGILEGSAVVHNAQLWRTITDLVHTVKIETRGNLVIMSIQFRLDKKTSQQLTSQPWKEIDPVDVWSIMSGWVATRCNNTPNARKNPLYIIPIRKIANIPVSKGKPDVRTNDEGIAVTPNGEPIYIPAEANNIESYEGELIGQLRQEDGTYTAFNPVTGGVAPPPQNRIIYVDWYSRKMAYVRDKGNVGVLEMARFVAGTPSKYLNIMRGFTEHHLALFSQILALGEIYAPQETYEFTSQMMNIVPDKSKRHALPFTLAVPRKDDKSDDEQVANLLQVLREDWPGKELVIEIFKKVEAYLESDLQTAFQRYSVLRVLHMFGWLKMVNKYIKDPEGMEVAANQSSQQYENQEEDPSWPGPEVPFVKDNDGGLWVMPHQNKVMNVTRNRPDNAVYGVDAGGGKTIISLLDVLRELGAGDTERPLVLCPDHLVSTHVREITEFTQGRVNVIPLSTVVIRKYGLDGIRKFLDVRPVNTIVVAGYTFLRQAEKLFYGRSPIRVYPYVDLLRQYNFDMVVMDESHYLKNASSTNDAIHRLISGIKKKRLMSGTLAPNNLGDLVAQWALLDPTVFGSPQDFASTFAEKRDGDKVLKWKDTAYTIVNKKMKSSAAYVRVGRKEWAAFLPKMIETFYPVNLTANQTAVYDSIIRATQDAMPPELKKKFLEILESARQDEESEDSEVAEAASRMLEQVMQMHLQRLEQFCTAPTSDAAGKGLTGEDAVSPKVKVCGQICLSHYNERKKGKILIFTSRIESATAVYEYLNALPEFRGKVIHYKAGEKDYFSSLFANDPDKIIMVGVGDSMDTGLNLQHASRLIRMEPVWTPGKVEQGNSRINRPMVGPGGKPVDDRPEIYVDTIVANGTIDVTKTAFLVAKMIQVAKFENNGDPKYDALNVPALFSMNLDNVFAMNNLEVLEEYFGAYQALVQTRNQDYSEYAAANPEMKWTPVKRGPNVRDALIMPRVPYQPQTEIYNSQKLGLVRYDKYLNLDENKLLDDDEKDEETDELAAERDMMVGMPVHTEYGDGEILRVMSKTIRVRVGYRSVVVNKLQAFVITRKATNAHDMKEFITRQNAPDMKLGPYMEEVPTEGDSIIKVREKAAERKTKRTKEEPATEEEIKPDKNAPGLLLSFAVMNDMLTIVLRNAESPDVANVAKQYGFRAPPSYIVTPIRRAPHLLAIVHTWSDAGLTMSKEHSDQLLSYYMTMRQFRNPEQVQTFGLSRSNDWRLFMREQIRPAKDVKTISPYPLVKDGKFYLALPYDGHPGSKVAMRESRKATKSRTVVDPFTGRDIQVSAPAPKWSQPNPKSHWYLWVRSKEAASAAIKQMAREGVNILEREELKKAYKALKFRVAKTVDED